MAHFSEFVPMIQANPAMFVGAVALATWLIDYILDGFF